MSALWRAGVDGGTAAEGAGGTAAAMAGGTAAEAAGAMGGEAGAAGGTWAPLSRAKRAAFHSLLQKLREPAAHSSLMAMSPPGLAPRARVNLVASAPNRSTQSSGSTVFPRDLDIFLPNWSRTSPCSITTRNGTASAGDLSRIAYRPNIIILATQKNRMS